MTHPFDPVLPSQTEDALWVAERGTRYLAHEMRVGKTAAAIRACDLLGARKVLWITTGTARLTHAHAWHDYGLYGWPVSVLTTGRDRPLKGGVTITSYDLAAGPLRKWLQGEQWDVLVIDEAHKLKTRTAKRTVAVLGQDCDRKSCLAASATHVMPLSGTPAPNHPGEMWPVLRALFPEAIADHTRGGTMPYWRFEDRYCKTKFSRFGDRKIVGGKNLRELRQRIAPFVRRRTFAETYPDAPGIATQMLFVPAQADLAELIELEKSEIVQQLGIRLDRITSETGREAVLRELENKVGLRLRRLTGLAKCPGVIEWAKDYLKERPKLVLMGWHSEVLGALCDGLDAFKPIRVSGGVAPKAKGEAATLFRKDPARRVFVGNLAAAGEAIDLSVADDVVLLESSWVPGENDQAIRRIVNMHKRNENVAWFATLSGSIDEHIQRTNLRKTQTLLELFG